MAPLLCAGVYLPHAKKHVLSQILTFEVFDRSRMTEQAKTLLANETLAKHYATIVCQGDHSYDVVRRIKASISKAPIDIASYFAEHKSLAALPVPGIGE